MADVTQIATPKEAAHAGELSEGEDTLAWAWTALT